MTAPPLWATALMATVLADCEITGIRPPGAEMMALFGRCANGERGSDLLAELRRVQLDCCARGCGFCYTAGYWIKRIEG